MGKYLVTLSTHLAVLRNGTPSPSIARQRLHFLYVLNDLLHHASHHVADPSLRNNLTHSLEPFLLDLFRLTASEAKSRVSKRISSLIDIWENEQYF